MDDSFQSANMLALAQAAAMLIVIVSALYAVWRKQWLEFLGLLMLVGWLGWNSLATYEHQFPPFRWSDLVLLLGLSLVAVGTAATSRGERRDPRA